MFIYPQLFLIYMAKDEDLEKRIIDMSRESTTAMVAKKLGINKVQVEEVLEKADRKKKKKAWFKRGISVIAAVYLCSNAQPATDEEPAYLHKNQAAYVNHMQYFPTHYLTCRYYQADDSRLLVKLSGKEFQKPAKKYQNLLP